MQSIILKKKKHSTEEIYLIDTNLKQKQSDQISSMEFGNKSIYKISLFLRLLY